MNGKRGYKSISIPTTLKTQIASGKPTNRLEIDLKIDFVDLWFAIVKVN